MMKIKNERPPIWEKAYQIFKVDPDTTVFTYGDTIYNPAGGNISDDLMVHESVHMVQQGKSPDEWWTKYFHNPKFRLDQEVEAYSAQYKFFCKKKKDRNIQMKFLMMIATHLSSDLYKLDITKQDAMNAIRNHN